MKYQSDRFKTCVSGLAAMVLGLGMALAIPFNAFAVSMTATIINQSDANSRDANTGVNPSGVHDFRTNVATTGSSTTSFSTRYTAGLYGEAQQGVIADLDLTKNLGFRIILDITAANPAEEWELSLSALANGGLAEKADSDGGFFDTGFPREGWVNATSLSVLSSDATETFNGISNPGTSGNWHPLGNNNNGGAAAASFSSGSDSAIYIGTGNAQIIIDFGWQVSLNSDASTLRDGNEMGYMFGEDDGGLSGTVTGNFNPGYNANAGGIWNRDITQDGYFVDGSILTTTVPEPSTALLLLLGMAGMASFARRN